MGIVEAITIRSQRRDRRAVMMTRSRLDTITACLQPIMAHARSRSGAIMIGTVATFGHLARMLTAFTRCTSPGHPMFLGMNVYFRHRAGKLEPGA
jgi:hypothetical protein